MRFPGNHYGKVSVGEMCFCEDSRAKPNHMACAHFPEKIGHMCFPISVILEKKLAGKNRTHFSNTTHDPILHTKYHYKFPTYFAFYAHAKFSSTVSKCKNFLAYIER